MARLSIEDIHGGSATRSSNPISIETRASVSAWVQKIITYRRSQPDFHRWKINSLMKYILMSGIVTWAIQINSPRYHNDNTRYNHSLSTTIENWWSSKKTIIPKWGSKWIPEGNEPYIYDIPELSLRESRELGLYIWKIQKEFSTLQWPNKNKNREISSQNPEPIINKDDSLYDFYHKNRKTIDNMARFAGGWKLNDVCWSTILVPWILYSSDNINDAWENIRLLMQVNYKHGKNWAIILEELVSEWLAEKINPQDLLLSPIPEWTILTYDGTQSNWAWKIYWHVEMTLSESTLDNGHFYYWKENTRAWWSASSKINLQSALKFIQQWIWIFWNADIKKAKRSLGGLIGAYRIKDGITAKQLIKILGNVDIESQEKNIPTIAILNYQGNQQ